MSRVKLTINSPLRKVRIIKGTDIESLPSEGPLPFFREKSDSIRGRKQDKAFKDLFADEDIELQNKSETSADIDISQYINDLDMHSIITEEPAQRDEPVLVENPVFSQAFSFSNIEKPILIDTSNIREESISISEAKQRIQEAYDKGFVDGKEVTGSTFLEDINKYQQWIRNFDNINNDLRIQYSRELGLLEEAVSKLAIIVAEHILNYEVSINADIVIQQLSKAISELDNEILMKIHLHPENVEALEKVKSSLVDDPSRIQNLTIVQDEKVGRGGCILETNAGIIDARISTQLHKISDALSSSRKPEINSEADFDEYNQTIQENESFDNVGD